MAYCITNTNNKEISLVNDVMSFCQSSYWPRT